MTDAATPEGPPPLPPVVAILGNKKSGKTTVAVGLIRELVARGHRVMSVKHGHHFRLDHEGTDSWRHRHEGGAERVVLAGPDEVAVLGSWTGGEPPSLREMVRRHLSDAEIVVAEGFRQESVHCIEVFRSTQHDAPIAPPEAVDPKRQLAVVTDRVDLGWPVPALDADMPDLAARLADLIVDRLLG